MIKTQLIRQMASISKKYYNQTFEKIEITDAGAEGMSIAKIDDIVVFIPYGVPGDIADIKITKTKKTYLEGKIVNIHNYSLKRATPFCNHFGLCGGCKWQHLKYEEQLFYKQKQVEENFKRIGKLTIPDILPIIPSNKTIYYRNKLEFTFSNRRWLSDEDMKTDREDRDTNGLGFHIQGMFDRIVDIEHCYLQAEPSNEIRLSLKKYAKENNLSFYDCREQTGFLRNIIIRNSSKGDLMVIIVFGYKDHEQIEKMLHFLYNKFPMITSLMYVINTKCNDVIYDLDILLFKGIPYIYEQFEGLTFKIGPVSFFQTNPEQAYELYKTIRNLADLQGHETVYDLYTGTGTIANFIAKNSLKVIGIENVASAIEDAKENSRINNISNTLFFKGDIVDVLNENFIKTNGNPSVIITDPPRSGMHKK